MFGTFLLVACTVLQLYVFWRADSVPWIARHAPLRLIIGLGVLLWLSFLLSHMFEHSIGGILAEALSFIGMTWLAVLFLTSNCLLSVEVFTGFGFLLPKLAPSLRGWALIAGAVLSVIALVQGLRPPVIQDYEVRLAGLPPERDGLVLVAVSDLHLGAMLGERWLAGRVAQIQAQRPDLVVLLGDIFEGHGPPGEEMLSTLGRISAPLGVWAVNGNHESYGRRANNPNVLEKSGVELLSNRWVEVRPGLVLAGVDDLTRRRRSGQGGDPISEALKGRPPGATILLSHTPWQAETVADAGAGLMLSGHTHAGQIWPFSYLVRLRYPLLEGRYEVGGMPVIVCRGTGTWGPRMRLWRPSEILRITLRSS
ncbi:MAG: metallophosphoesterase [Acidobacteriia bacterium]|nr:metallophosphoesterase [Terriglobia bacterium]